MDLKRQLGVSYNSAWMVKRKLMQAMRKREDSQPLRDVVELDDAYLGGETSGGRRGRGAQDALSGRGAGQRGGAAILTVAELGRPLRLRLTPGLPAGGGAVGTSRDRSTAPTTPARHATHSATRPNSATASAGAIRWSISCRVWPTSPCTLRCPIGS